MMRDSSRVTVGKKGDRVRALGLAGCAPLVRRVATPWVAGEYAPRLEGLTLR